MSHQTGIKANDALKKFFSKCKDGKIRLFKVAIEEEQLVLKDHHNEKHKWEKDYDKYVAALVEENQPCYILFRLDEKNSLGYEWLLISWCPDTSPIRQKMLYASTKATLKQEFGSSQIKDELHGTVLSDITLEGYKRHKKSVAAPAPLSMREEELQEIKKTEVNTDISISTKQQTLSGVEFPLTQTATQAIEDMIRGSYDYLQFRIDIPKETIHLVCAENISLQKLPSKIPSDAARYHLYKFKHTHEGDYNESMVFIYSMPGYNLTVKERMLYSSCKNPLTNSIANLGLDITKKIEIDSGSELTEQFLYEELHPTNSLHRPKFAKPKGPPGRGPKRMTKNQ
ncbi:twinfilin [Anthonomus grandis grandis]|uniref:twinfilin n=1 Tax=Anthonomus grandis grandis TaxID=2921223 RepID=UPI002166BC4C|nr:twinfilin [Anthonomus grandis grandis]XP_050314672.1 twinfilin [Anthonomus grandis grandis]